MTEEKLIEGRVTRYEVLAQNATFKLAERKYKNLLNDEREVLKGRIVESEYTWVVSFITAMPEEKWHENYRITVNNVIGGMVMIKGEDVTEDDLIRALNANGIAIKGAQGLEIKQLFRRQTYKAIVRGTGINYKRDGEYLIDCSVANAGK